MNTIISFFYLHFSKVRIYKTLATLFCLTIVGFCCFVMYVRKLVLEGPEILAATTTKNHHAAFSLLERGVNINVTDDRGRTPLMWAANFRDYELVQAYVRYGANINQKDGHGRTALTWAGYGGDARIYSFLKAAGATK